MGRQKQNKSQSAVQSEIVEGSESAVLGSVLAISRRHICSSAKGEKVESKSRGRLERYSQTWGCQMFSTQGRVEL